MTTFVKHPTGEEMCQACEGNLRIARSDMEEAINEMTLVFRAMQAMDATNTPAFKSHSLKVKVGAMRTAINMMLDSLENCGIWFEQKD